MKESLWMMSGSMREGMRESMKDEVSKIMKKRDWEEGNKKIYGKS